MYLIPPLHYIRTYSLFTIHSQMSQSGCRLGQREAVATQHCKAWSGRKDNAENFKKSFEGAGKLAAHSAEVSPS